MGLRGRALAVGVAAATAKVGSSTGSSVAQQDPPIPTLPVGTLPPPPTVPLPTVPFPTNPPADQSPPLPFPATAPAITSSCSSDAYVARSSKMYNTNNPAVKSGVVQIWYSPSCNKVAASYDNGEQGGPCQPHFDGCGFVGLYRSSNGAVRAYTESPAGYEGAKTSFVTWDSTVFAEAEWFGMTFNYFGRTDHF